MAPKKAVTQTPTKRPSSVGGATPRLSPVAGVAASPVANPGPQPPRPSHVAASAAVVPAREWGAPRQKAMEKLCPTLGPGSFMVNADHWVEIEDAWDIIQRHHLFNGIQMLDALDIVKKKSSVAQSSAAAVDGSHIHPFHEQSYVDAMGSRGLYTCGCNLLWASPFYTPLPGVPINRRGAPGSAYERAPAEAGAAARSLPVWH